MGTSLTLMAESDYSEVLTLLSRDFLGEEHIFSLSYCPQENIKMDFGLEFQKAQ